MGIFSMGKFGCDCEVGLHEYYLFCCFSVRYWSCSDSVVFDGFPVRYWSCSDSAVLVVFLLDIGAVPTVWYLLLFC